MEVALRKAISSFELRKNLEQLDEERIGRKRRMALRAMELRRRGYNAKWWMLPMVRLMCIGLWVCWVSWTWPDLGRLLWR